MGDTGRMDWEMGRWGDGETTDHPPQTTEDEPRITKYEIRVPESVARRPSSVESYPNTQRPTPNAQPARHLKVPHIGWNTLRFRKDTRLFRGLNQDERVYFVHSYYPVPDDEEVVSAWTEYGGAFCSAVESENLFATQFHPEKSGAVGLRILRNFASLAP